MTFVESVYATFGHRHFDTVQVEAGLRKKS